MYNSVRLEKEIERYEYVSFDMFDTLVKRNVGRPEEVFEIVEREYNRTAKRKLKNWRETRMLAEAAARGTAGGGEVDINDIFAEIELPEWEKKKLKKLELEWEVKVCQRNVDFYSVYEHAKKNGKKIIVTSDMYLPRETIDEILGKAGIEYDELFLSNEAKASKRGGSIFRIEMRKLGISAGQMLHIGDSKRADFLGPMQCGVKAILIPKRVNKLRYYRKYRPRNLDEKMAWNFLNNNLPLERDIYYQVGFEVLGLMLYVYAKWLKENLEKEGISKVFFLAREGALLKRAFDLMNDNPEIESKYLYVSRRSTRGAMLKEARTLEEVFEICKMRRLVDVEGFFENVGLDVNKYGVLLRKYGLKKTDDVRSAQDFEKVFEEIRNAINESGWKSERELRKYLEVMGFSGKVAVSDIGWEGAMQDALTRVMDKGKVLGFYLGAVRGTQARKESNKKMKGFLFEWQDKQFDEIRGFLYLFEGMFLALHGTTIYYKDGKPVLGESEYSRSERKIYNEIQNGAVDFVKKAELLNLPTIDAGLAYYGMKKLGMKPKVKDTRLFGDFPFSDTDRNRLAKPKSFFAYLVNPKQFAKDFYGCGWKIGFLKRLLKLPLPYDKVIGVIYLRKG